MQKKNNMIEMFKGYLDYSDEKYKNIWENSIIVVDSNILLNFYRYSEKTRNNIFKILEKLKDRLWIPYQVGKEFFNNKNKVMVNSYTEYDTLNSALRKKIQEAKEEINKRKNNQLNCKAEINNILDTSMKQIEEILNNEKVGKMPKFEKNAIEHKMLELFNNSIGERIVDDEFEKIKKEGIRRFEKEIPLGYKDDQKDENGDYYIFYSMMKESKARKKDVIFITDDVKEEWFNIINGEKHGGRNELLNEFYKETNQLLIIYTSDGFMEAYNKNLGKCLVDETTISELKTIRNIRNKEHHNYYKDYIDLFQNIDREELLRIIRTFIQKMDLPYSDKEKLSNDLRTIRHYNYYNSDLADKKLKILIDNITDYIKNKYGENTDYNSRYSEIYQDYILSLKNLRSRTSQIELNRLLIVIIKGHLEYLSRHSSAENDYMSHKLQSLLLELSEITKNGNHYNKRHIIEQLDSIMGDKNLV